MSIDAKRSQPESNTWPAIIEEGQSTTVIPESTKLIVSPQGSLVIEILDAKKLSNKSDTDLNNPIHLEILWNQLISAVDEAAASLLRSAFSTVVRESYDFSCVITDSEGNALVQATDSIPSFIGTLPDTVKHFIRRFRVKHYFQVISSSQTTHIWEPAISLIFPFVDQFSMVQKL